MKFLTQWLLVLLTVLNPILAGAALTDFDRQELAVKNWLAPYNSGFESGKAKWTASGGTLAAVTSGTNLLVGKGSATWDSGSAAQTLTSQTITIEKGYYGQNCEAGIVAQTPSGTATHTVQAYDGTNILVSATIVSSTTPRLNAVNFPCPQSGTVALRLVSVAADEPLIAIDDAYLGLARNVGSTQLISEWRSYTPTIGNLGTGSTVTNSGFWRQFGDSMQIIMKVTKDASGGSGSSAVTFSLPSGYEINTAKLPTTSLQSLGYATDMSSGTVGSVLYLTSTQVYLYAMTVGSGQWNGSAFSANKQVTLNFTIPIVGWTAQTIVMPDAQGWYVDATIAGANASLGTSNVSSYTEITNGSLTMTTRTGSAAAGIMCSSTNAAATPTTSTSTCSAGSESLGINASVPRSGAYEVCASFSHYTEADQGEGVNTAFQLVRTATNAQTILEEGGSRPSARNSPLAIATGTAQAINFPYNTCGIFQLSAGVNGFRIMYEQLVTGTPNGSEVLADALSTVGQRDVRFTIKPVSQQQQAILANSVSTSATNGEKIESLRVDASCTSSPCAIGSQSGAFTDVTRSTTGNYSVNYPASTWSAGPRCVVTAGDANTLASCKINSSATTTSVSIFCPNTSTGAGLDSDFNIICMGPR